MRKIVIKIDLWGQIAILGFFVFALLLPESLFLAIVGCLAFAFWQLASGVVWAIKLQDGQRYWYLAIAGLAMCLFFFLHRFVFIALTMSIGVWYLLRTWKTYKALTRGRTFWDLI